MKNWQIVDVIGGERCDSCATIAGCLGDLFFYKGRDGFLSRFTADMEDKKELFQKACSYYTIQKNNGDPLGEWNLAQTYKEIMKLVKSDEERKDLKDKIWECSLKALKNEANLLGEEPYNAENYYIDILRNDIVFTSRMACMENMVGIVYSEGIGVPTDLQVAKEHFRKGIEYKYAYSYNRLAQIYEKEATAILEGLVANENVDLEKIEKMKRAYITAFLIFWKQIQEVGEHYAMNRLSWYLYEGISVISSSKIPDEQKYEMIESTKIEVNELEEYKYYVKLKWEWIGIYLENNLENNIFWNGDELVRRFEIRYKNGLLKEDIILWLKCAAFSEDSYAIERLKRIENGELVLY